MKKIIKNTNDLLKISLTLASLIVALSAVYYYGIFLPREARLNIRRIAEKKVEYDNMRQELLKKCLQRSHLSYTYLWNQACQAQDKEDACALDSETVQNIENAYQSKRADCFQFLGR